MDLLLIDARVRDDREPVDIGIEGGRIVAIEPHIEAEAAHTIDAAGNVVMPGFVESHLHLDKALIHRRRPARDGTLAEAIRLTGEIKASQDREDVLERSRAVLDMALGSGTLMVRAHPDVDPIQGLIGVETALELKQEYAGLVDLQIVAFPQEGIIGAPGSFELMEEAMRMGATVVGGCPYVEPSWEDAKRHIDMVFELAQRFDVPVDLHADFADDAIDERFASARYIAERALALGYDGRVSLGHVTSLGALTAEEARPVIDALARADVSIIALPATDLYLGGRNDARGRPGGFTPVRLLRDRGVNVALSSNNVRNAFTPFGKADLLQIASLFAHAAHFGTPRDQAEVLRMLTDNAARSVGRADGYGLQVGRQADLVVLGSAIVADVLADIPPRLWVIKEGRVVVETHIETTIHRRLDG
jgi:cytosine deaminase